MVATVEPITETAVAAALAAVRFISPQTALKWGEALIVPEDKADRI